MTSLVKKNILLLGYGRPAAFFAGGLLFSLSGRMGGRMTYEQHILSAVSDHYYLTYFMIPLLLFSFYSIMEDDGETVVMRFGSYFSYFCRKWLSAGAVAGIIILIQTACILLSGIGLPAGNNWALPAGAASLELFSALKVIFAGPLTAFIAYTIYQYAGMWFFAGICMWIIHFAGRRQSVKILAVLYLTAVFWVKVPALQTLPFTGLNHLMILHHNLGNRERPAETGIAVILLFILILLTVRNLWHSRLTFASFSHRGLLPYYMRELTAGKNTAILLAAAAVIVLYKGFGNPYLGSGEEWIAFLFSGHGTGYLNLLSFLEMLIVNGAPLYLLAAFMERAVSGQSLFITIRIKGRKELSMTLITAGFLFLLLYCFVWLAGGFIGIYLFGFRLSGMAFQQLVCLVFLKFLDLLFQYLLMLAVYVRTKQITAGFLVLTAGNLLCMMPFRIMTYLPFGMSSSVRIDIQNTGTGISVTLAFGILTLFITLITLWHIKYGCRKLLN